MLGSANLIQDIPLLTSIPNSPLVIASILHIAITIVNVLSIQNRSTDDLKHHYHREKSDPKGMAKRDSFRKLLDSHLSSFTEK